MTDDKLRVALDDLFSYVDVGTIAEGALKTRLEAVRAALAASATDEPEPLDRGPCPHGYATRRPCPQCGVALAASAPDEGPDPAGTKRVLMTDELFDQLGADRVEWGEPDGRGFYSPAVYARPSAPAALDVERLGDALARVFPVSFRGEPATEPLKSRALLMDYAHRIAREYAALQEQPE